MVGYYNVIFFISKINVICIGIVNEFVFFECYKFIFFLILFMFFYVFLKYVNYFCYVFDERNWYKCFMMEFFFGLYWFR